MPTLPEREVSLAAAKPVVLMTAGTSRQFAGALPGMQVPAFSYLALGALRGWADQNRDGAVTAGEAVSFMNEVMSTTVKGRAQTPQLNPESSSGVILGKASKEAAELPLNEVVLWLSGSTGGAGGAVITPPDDSSYAAVLSAQKKLELEFNSGRLLKRKILTSRERPAGDVLTVVPLSEVEQQFVAAADQFIARAKAADVRAPPIAYQAAEIFYTHDQFEEARTRFEGLISRWSNSEQAKVAVNLIVETYLIALDFEHVEEVPARLRQDLDPKNELDAHFRLCESHVLRQLGHAGKRLVKVEYIVNPPLIRQFEKQLKDFEKQQKNLKSLKERGSSSKEAKEKAAEIPLKN
jgi:hypothetical protein